MFASPSHNPAKMSAEGKAKSADAAAGPKDLRRPNPIWQSLAMHSGVVQAKLTVGQADDPYEREADRVADQVMRMPAPQSDGCGLSITPVTAHQAQRKCAECEEEEAGELQRNESGGAEAPATAPPIVHETLSSPGQPLDAATRAYFEPRFGHSFADVRLHTGGQADIAVRGVSAHAFTVGNRIAFAAGQYAPHTEPGRRLLAHELTHVLQQSGTATPPSMRSISSDNDSAGRLPYEATDRNPASIATRKSLPGLQRKMKVDNASGNIPASLIRRGLVQTNAQTVQDYLDQLCPSSSGFAVDPSTGEVKVAESFCTRPHQRSREIFGRTFPLLATDPSPAEKTDTPKSCSCLCDIANSEDHLWIIEIKDNITSPETQPDDQDAGMRGSGTGGRIIVPSPNSTKVWGAATAEGDLRDFPAWELLIHELCGHARLLDQGKHYQDYPRNRAGKNLDPDESKYAGHQKVVELENEVRKEHKLLPLRATFKQPYCGESFFRAREGEREQWPSDPMDPRFTYLNYCQRWRREYNEDQRKKGLPKYEIDESIP